MVTETAPQAPTGAFLSIWDRVTQAVAAASAWDNIDPAAVSELIAKLQLANKNLGALDSQSSSYVLQILGDKRAATYLGDKRQEQQSRYAALQSILQPRLSNFQGTTLFRDVPKVRKPAVPKVKVSNAATLGTTLGTQTDAVAVKRVTRQSHLPRITPATVGDSLPPEKTAPALVPFNPRDYQIENFAAFEAALAHTHEPNAVFDPEIPFDRGYISDPPQTGKSKASTEYAKIAQKFFPGKKILIIVPQLIIEAQMLDDFLASFDGVISVIDGKHKDASGDVILASAYTLRRPENLKLIDPNEIGLTIYRRDDI